VFTVGWLGGYMPCCSWYRTFTILYFMLQCETENVFILPRELCEVCASIKRNSLMAMFLFSFGELDQTTRRDWESCVSSVRHALAVSIYVRTW